MHVSFMILISFSLFISCRNKTNNSDPLPQNPVENLPSVPISVPDIPAVVAPAEASLPAPAMPAIPEAPAPPGPAPEPLVTLPPDTRPLVATVSTESFACDTLDYGMYWFGKGDLAQKSTPDTRSSFYDRTKPTVIYVHGWQTMSHLLKKRETFNYKKTEPVRGVNVDAADAWIDAGWNVGIFYWNQFADETDVGQAEDKIWKDTVLTWKNCAGKVIPVTPSLGNVSDLLFKTYTEALKDYVGPNIRLAGHSLGSQLVTRLAAKVADAAKAGKLDAHLIPKRIALLDPWWSSSKDPKAAHGTLVRELIAPLKSQQMIFEWYKTSTLAELFKSDLNLELKAMIGQTQIALDYYSTANQVSRHMSAPFVYFLSFKDPPPPGCSAPCVDTAPSASVSDARMLDLMTRGVLWQQITGKNTAETRDNGFVVKTK